jgi:hypothetical protein
LYIILIKAATKAHRNAGLVASLKNLGKFLVTTPLGIGATVVSVGLIIGNIYKKHIKVHLLSSRT